MSYGRIFTIPWTGTLTSAGGDTDLWEVLPADDHPVRIRGIILGQSSEVGDTSEEIFNLSVIRMTATITGGSGGSAGVPECPESNAITPNFTSETNNSTVATTSGATDVLYRYGWNERSTPYEIYYDVDWAPKAAQGEGLFVRLTTGIADDLTFAGTLVVEEA